VDSWFFGGMRSSELVPCPLDCIKQDAMYWCIIWRKKSKEDHVLPISREIAKVIQEQQQYIRHLGNSFNYPFVEVWVALVKHSNQVQV